LKPRHILVIILVCLGIFLLFAVAPLIKILIVLNSKTPEEMETTQIYQPAPTPGNDLQAIEADAEIVIPASAREIHGMISGFRDLATWVRLDLPGADLPSFMQNTHCTEPLKTTDPGNHFPRDLDPDWWQPQKATNLQVCSGLHDHLSQTILVDRSKVEMITIYVFSSTGGYTKITTQTPKP
jgi:hypothetical protein